MRITRFSLAILFAILIVNCKGKDKREIKEAETVETSMTDDDAEKVEEESNGVPDVVLKNFKQKYKGENDPDFKLDDKGNWEAHFKIDDISYRADFNADGSWIETENSIKKGDLPKSIKEAIKKDYDDEEITEIERVDHFEKGIFYDVEFKKKGKNKDIEFREDGTIIN